MLHKHMLIKFISLEVVMNFHPMHENEQELCDWSRYPYIVYEVEEPPGHQLGHVPHLIWVCLNLFALSCRKFKCWEITKCWEKS